MALSSRGKKMVGALTIVVLVGAAFVGYRLATKPEDEPLIQIPGLTEEPPQCLLLGEEAPSEDVAGRPAVAIKVENIAESRPQAGLLEADVIFEQEAEGGITRFTVVYQCGDAERVGPVRSARPVDTDVLAQLGTPLFGYAGGVDQVQEEIAAAGIVDLNYNDAAEAYTRDPNRSPPHDLYTTTDALREAAGDRGEPPPALFSYADEPLARGDGSRRSREVHADFSAAADVIWRYRGNTDSYVRFHGTAPHTVEDGTQVSVTNVVAMMVRRLPTRITDPAGNPVPNFEVVGSGRAFVFRNGRVIRGDWERPSEGDPTSFVDREGQEITLSPGTTWIMLFPTDARGPLDF